MSGGPPLSQLEELVLLSLVRLGDDAYGMTIRQEIESRSGRPASIAAVYAALDRLERGRLVSSRQSAPLPERGGRARKHFRVLPVGAQALQDARQVMDRMWEGLDGHPDLGADA